MSSGRAIAMQSLHDQRLLFGFHGSKLALAPPAFLSRRTTVSRSTPSFSATVIVQCHGSVSASANPSHFESLAKLGAYAWNDILEGDWQGYFCSFAPVGVSLGISHALCIGLESEIQVAVLRSFAQMLFLGLFLKFSSVENVLWVPVAATIMVFLAGRTAAEQAKELPRSQVVATISLALGAFGTMVLMVLLQAFPLGAGSLIAVMGHILGNAMIMVGRTLKGLQHDIIDHAGQIEAALALGATPYNSVQKFVRQAFLRGMAPMVDAIKVMGLVSLPGNMTGLLLGGAAPVEAVIAQIKLINAVLAAAAISCTIATFLGWRMLFTPNHQLQN